MILFGQNVSAGKSRVGASVLGQNQSIKAGDSAIAVRNGNTEISNAAAGKIFEGTVLDINRNQVLIRLANGMTLNARMEESVPLLIGQEMQFQVKSNNGQVVSIRPYTENQINPTLVRALEAANIPVSEKTLAMVRSMMDVQMSIDKQTIQEMVRCIYQFPEADPETLVRMKSLNISLTAENVEQFSQYQEQPISLMVQMEDLLAKIPETLKELAFKEEQMEPFQADGPGRAQDFSLAAKPENLISEEMASKVRQKGENAQMDRISDQEGLEKGASARQIHQKLLAMAAGESKMASESTIKEILTEEQRAEFQKEILSQPFPDVIKEEVQKENGSVRKFLEQIEEFIKDQPEALQNRILSKLAKSDGYGKLLFRALEENWLFHPEKEELSEKMKDYYKKLDSQIKNLLNSLEAFGDDGKKLQQSTQNLKNNLEFMNQINQAYTYLQIPLKLSGQNAHSDLYVYTNKKGMRDKEGKLSALLHLDLENLGSTDIYVEMEGTAVAMKFYLSDEVSFGLIEKHMHELQEQIEKKGYSCKVMLENREERMDPVEEFLKSEHRPEDTFQRFSFDVRA